MIYVVEIESPSGARASKEYRCPYNEDRTACDGARPFTLPEISCHRHTGEGRDQRSVFLRRHGSMPALALSW